MRPPLASRKYKRTTDFALDVRVGLDCGCVVVFMCDVLFFSQVLGRRHFKKISREYFSGFFRAAEIRAALFEEYDSFLKLRSVQERYTTSEYVPSGTRQCPCR